MKKELKIYLASPRGFCAGVKRAIEIVEKAINKYGAPVYVRHEIVHNKQVVDELNNRLNPKDVLVRLGELGITSLIIEGGATTIKSFLDIFLLVGIEYPTRCKLFFLNSANFFPELCCI